MQHRQQKICIFFCRDDPHSMTEETGSRQYFFFFKCNFSFILILLNVEKKGQNVFCFFLVEIQNNVSFVNEKKYNTSLQFTSCIFIEGVLGLGEYTNLPNFNHLVNNFRMCNNKGQNLQLTVRFAKTNYQKCINQYHFCFTKTNVRMCKINC